MGYRFKTYQKAPELAYKVLRLIEPAKRDSSPDRFLDLGTFRIIESQAAVLAVVAEFIKELSAVSNSIDAEYNEKTGSQYVDHLYKRKRQVLQQLQKRCVLSYDDFTRFVGHEQSEKKAIENIEYKKGSEQIRLMARKRFADLQASGGFSKSFSGYQTYLRAVNKKLHQVLSQDLPALVKEKPRRSHSYIVSTTETGKTELLKAICLNYIHQPDYAGVVVLDPGGDMAPQMARWQELIPSSQLVYIDPYLSKYNVPVINPFDAEGFDEQDRSLLTEQIVLALASMVEGKLGGTLSVNMETVLVPSVRLLIDLPNTTLRDLSDLMKGDEKLIEAGRRSSEPDIADFFQTEFSEVDKTTKRSIVSKLRNILNKPALRAMLCGHTSINLERLMSEHKFIVVNLAKGRLGTGESSALGTLLVSLIQAIAMKRERLKEAERPMTHLIIDECQNFITHSVKEIIRETRKFGLAVTLAQQEVGGDMPSDFEDVVVSTTNVKVVGRSNIKQTKRTGALIGVPPEDIADLEAGQFYWKNGTAPPFLLRVRSDRLNYKGGCSNDLWLKVAEQQQRFYYRRHGDQSPVAGNDKPNDVPLSAGGKRRYKFK